MENLIGKKFGNLTVLKYSHTDKKGNTYWICECDCGKIKTVRRGHLLSGGVKSCGCALYEKRIKTHGLYSRNPRLNKIYNGMIDRCYKEKRYVYRLYGERGIKVCPAWLKDPKKFEEWSMNNGYAKNLTIDRINVNGDYCPENCRWVDNKIQQRNKRNNRYIFYNGERKCLSEWCECMNLSKSAISHRVERKGVTWEESLKYYIERKYK